MGYKDVSKMAPGVLYLSKQLVTQHSAQWRRDLVGAHHKVDVMKLSLSRLITVDAAGGPDQKIGKRPLLCL